VRRRMVDRLLAVLQSFNIQVMDPPEMVAGHQFDGLWEIAREIATDAGGHMGVDWGCCGNVELHVWCQRCVSVQCRWSSVLSFATWLGCADGLITSTK